jgi:hypothetical protein
MLAATGGEALLDTQVICIGYNIISTTRLFELQCCNWHQNATPNKTMVAFQDQFCLANLNQLSTVTTGLAGLHGATNNTTITSINPVESGEQQQQQQQQQPRMIKSQE